MAEDLKTLLSERQALDARIAEMTRQGRVNAIAQIRQIAADFGLTAVDLSRAIGTKPIKPPAPAKYRDPATGMTWTGNGMRPRWLKESLASGKKLESFLINQPTALKSVPAAKKAPAKKAAKR